jgi:heme/copper-type cytochrome/quinol oxidase subunit 2
MTVRELSNLISNKYDQFWSFIFNMELSEIFWWCVAIIVFIFFMNYSNEKDDEKDYKY